MPVDSFMRVKDEIKTFGSKKIKVPSLWVGQEQTFTIEIME